MSVSRNDIENIILGMADIVMENRDLRRHNKVLKECNDELTRINAEHAKSSEEETKNMVSMILKKQIMDMEKKANKIRCELCGGTGAQMVKTEGKYEVVCPHCGCTTRKRDDVFSAINAWEEGDTYFPDDDERRTALQQIMHELNVYCEGISAVQELLMDLGFEAEVT